MLDDEKPEMEEFKPNYDFQEPKEVQTVYTKPETLTKIKLLESKLKSGKLSKEEFERVNNEIIEIMNGLVVESEIIVAEQKRIEEKQDEEYLKQKIHDLQNFDQSDVRLNTLELDERDIGHVLARTHDDHIEILVRNWFSELKNLESIIHTINHESIHVPINRIFYEEGFSKKKHNYDLEWAFYAGGIDSLFGVDHSMTAPFYYLGMDEIRNSMIVNPEYKRQYQIKKWDYDL